ncbi:MAG: hypothetical protein QG670_745 [Thermoproteota archaeon]|nr:hypothetical protein [Thermoproteota archaeon]
MPVGDKDGMNYDGCGRSMKRLGLNLEQCLIQDVIAKLYRTIIDSSKEETNQLEILGDAIKKP